MSLQDVEAKGATEAGKRQVPLESKVRHWPTPNTRDSEESGGEGKGYLPRAARAWPTPTARDWRSDPAATERTRTDGTTIAQPLNRVALTFPSFPLAPTIWKDGDTFWRAPRTWPPLFRFLLPVYRSVFLRGWLRLNPAFSEWLMGWPVGWSDYRSSGTEWCRWRRAWRSHLFGTE